MSADTRSMWMACPVCGGDSKSIEDGSYRMCAECEHEAPAAFWCIPDEIYELRREVDHLKTELDAIKHSIVQEVGGTVEGRPTNSLNYLQRIRELRRIESALKDERIARAVLNAFWRMAHGHAEFSEYDKLTLTAHMMTALLGFEVFSRDLDLND